MNETTEVQPTGASIERTMDVIPNILTDPEFAEEVRAHHDWPATLDQKDIAILFLTGRFQWAVDIISRQTATLKKLADGNTTRIVDLEDRVEAHAVPVV